MRASAKRRSKAGIVEVPTKLFVDLYFAAPIETANALDALLGRDEIDAMIEKIDALKE